MHSDVRRPVHNNSELLSFLPSRSQCSLLYDMSPILLEFLAKFMANRPLESPKAQMRNMDLVHAQNARLSLDGS